MSIAEPPVEATNTELVRWAFGQLNAHTLDGLRQIWDDAIEERFPNTRCRGADEVARYFEDVFAAVPDLHVDVVNIAEQHDDVYVHWQVTGTHTGAPWFGIAPTGRRLEMDGIDHFVVRDGKVISNFVVFDQMQFARAIGMLPAQDGPADKAMKAAFNAKTKLAARMRR